jgi:hypothetical protein
LVLSEAAGSILSGGTITRPVSILLSARHCGGGVRTPRLRLVLGVLRTQRYSFSTLEMSSRSPPVPRAADDDVLHIFDAGLGEREFTR